ncbi:MAG: flavodoxin family protein [Phycisphaerae bacterium]|nr:flavodoxin family protein [Phycisphaerae bacterium]
MPSSPSPVKRILGVVGSPRQQGNTHVLVAKVLEGAAEAGAQTDTLLLGETEIRECDGCHACWRDKPCTKDDDMNDVYPRIVAADAVVFGTPVYWYAPTALMKAFIDRFVYFNCPDNHKKIAGKAAAVVVPFEEDRPETADLVVAFFEKCFQYLEMRLAGTLIVPGVTRRGEVLAKPDVLARAKDLGRSLAASSRPGWRTSSEVGDTNSR